MLSTCQSITRKPIELPRSTPSKLLWILPKKLPKQLAKQLDVGIQRPRHPILTNEM